MNTPHRSAALIGPVGHNRRILVAALLDDSGQDLIEYALLGAIVGVASILTWQLLAAKVGAVYSAADVDVQTVSACTPNPGGGGCP